MAMNSSDWKRFYADEWARLTSAGMPDAWARLPNLALPKRGCVVFPHTRLARSAGQVVPVAKAIAEAGVRHVVALGPMHGGLASRAAEVKLARSGNPAAIAAFRKAHSAEDTFAAEEFCLDNLRRLVALFGGGARIDGAHPFLTNADPASMPGMPALRAKIGPETLVVATADPIHHGVGYDTPPEELREPGPQTLAYARAEVNAAFELLSRGDYGGFSAHARGVKSDFRDVGPVLRELLPGEWNWRVESMSLVPYEDVLGCAAPTWVAAPSVVVECR